MATLTSIFSRAFSVRSFYIDPWLPHALTMIRGQLGVVIPHHVYWGKALTRIRGHFGFVVSGHHDVYVWHRGVAAEGGEQRHHARRRVVTVEEDGAVVGQIHFAIEHLERGGGGERKDGGGEGGGDGEGGTEA